MAISMKDLRKVKATLPPRTLVYGPPGKGKTTLAAEFPAPVFIQSEDGAPSGLELDTWGLVASYGEVIEQLGALYNEDHGYRTVVLDTLDRLEPMVWTECCRANSWASIETPGYGKGYLAADAFWRDILDGLNALRRDRGMNVVLLAHSEVTRFDDPQTVSYSRFDISLHKRAIALVQGEVDAILFLNDDPAIKQETVGRDKTRAHAEGSGMRWIYTDGRPAFVAKNRFSMPPKLKFELGKGYAALAPYFPGGSEATEAEKPKAAKKAA